ncbi:MAG: carboxypeptidase-like regulatory domain-containing protein, partial [Bacteroidota bacterium]
MLNSILSLAGRWPGRLILALLLVLPSTAWADGRIVGRVTDGSTGETLPGANVIIQGTSRGAATDLEGRYTIPNVPPGPLTLVVTYIGYESQTREVTIEDNVETEADFVLKWEGVQGEEIVITAQAEGQISAINQQLSSNTITNIVSGDRIQELPDVNAAESIGRLPGVSIQRSGGEANKIAIRGLSPKYNTVTVNGVRVPATGGDDRSVDLSLIAPNMLDGIEVMKAITPDKDADAIGGAVDLRLREAPAGLGVDVQAQGGFNQLQSYYGNYKFVGTVSNRFLQDRLGIIASANLDEFDRSADKFSGNYRQSSDPETGEPLIILSNLGLREETVRRGRTGASLVLDYRIPRGKVTANTFYNQLDFDGVFRVNNISIDGNRHFYDTEDRSGTTSVFTGALKVEQVFDRFQYDVGVARTASRAENPNDFFWQFSQEGNAVRGQVDEDTLPTEVSGLLNVDTLATGLQNVFVYSTDRQENETSAQFNLQVPFRFGNQVSGFVKTGGKFRWLDRSNDEQQDGRNGIYYGSGAGDLNETLECVAEQVPEWNLDEVVGEIGWLPIELVMEDYDRSDFLDGDYPLG